MRILGIDTSGKTASAAILDTQQHILLGEHTVYTSRMQSQVIMPMVKELLTDCQMTVQDVDCFAVSAGPGSYTGLRIGIAAVQGMAMVRDTPCIGVSTLEAMASQLYAVPQILSVMHARNDLFYTAHFMDEHTDTWDAPERMSADELLHTAEIAESLEYYDSVVLVGDGAKAFAEQYAALPLSKRVHFRFAPEHLRLQSAAGVCLCAARYPGAWGTAAELTASYLQAVNITRKEK